MPEHVDVLIIGAGLSGIGAGHHLQTNCPEKTFAILESRDTIGGTWDLFRYPGIRSDSDMYTLGYSFRPWTDDKAIADGDTILQYVRDTAAETGIDRTVRFGHRVVSADWSTADALWTVQARRTDTNETVRMTCRFLHTCCGYYRYDEGFTPAFVGTERFTGEIVHPQLWPENLDYAGKRVVVIGSGATAVTLVPAMAATAAHVTMLQRSPSYVISRPAVDKLAVAANRWLPTRVAYVLMRWKNVLLTSLSFQLSRRRPGIIKAVVRKGAQAQLPPGYDIDTHFKPSYNPWDQRLCVVPDGDLFKAIRSGSASVVTDHIETFTEDGIKLQSGDELAADIIVTATGLKLIPFGGMQLSVDGERVDIAQRFSYKGMMLSGVPNFAFAVGYTNASWTLKCDLTCEYVCRLINHMDEHGEQQCMPVNADPSMRELPFLDFSSGYVQRAIADFPKQGSKTPWRLHQNYALDIVGLKFRTIEDGAMQFSKAPAGAPASAPAMAGQTA